MSIFDKFTNGINQEEIDALLNANDDFGGEYKKVPAGDYEVAVEKIELGKTKNGDDKLSIWFKILVGEYKGCYLFKNVALVNEQMLGMALKFLKALESTVNITGFDSAETFENLLADIKEDLDEKGIEYEVEYVINKAGFGEVKKILQVFFE